MGLEQPGDGLRSRFSARHGVAVGLLYGRAGLAEFSDAAATAPDVARLRALVTLDVDPAVARDAAVLRVSLRPAGSRASGQPAVEVAVEHTRGSAARPLTDDELLGKMRALFGPVLGERAADRARDAVGKLPGAEDTTALLAAIRPEVTSMTTTDEILALAAGVMADGAEIDGDRGGRRRVPRGRRPRRGQRRGPRAARGPPGRRATRLPAPSGPFPGDAAWTAWLTAAAAIPDGAVVAADGARAVGEAAVDAGERAAGTPRPVWCSVFGAAIALTDPPGSAPVHASVTAAIAAGLGAAAIVESGLDDWDGWSSGTVAAAIGAGVTAGLLLGLAGPRLRAAIGICATQAAGLRAAAGTDAFPLQVGKAAFNGVEAALLARAGLTAPDEPLDGRRGLFALFGS